MRFYLLATLKVLLQVVLLMVFLWYFGLPALEKYHDKRVMIVSTKESRGGIPGPHVTVCRRKPNITSIEDCRDAGDVGDCILARTFNQSETVTMVDIGYDTKTPLMNSSLWSEDVAYVKYGRCHTINVPGRVSTNYKQHELTFHLKQHDYSRDDAATPATPVILSTIKATVDCDSVDDEDSYYNAYDMYVHDGNFILNENFFGLPKMYKWVSKATKNYVTHFYMVEHHRMNLPGSPCKDDLTYSFVSCVKKSLSSQVGCKLPWDTSTPDQEDCSTIDQYM